MKKELHVFGCSFTDYPQWPIWADWLAMYFPDKSFFKHATGGVGNKAIFNKVINVLSTMDSYQDKVFVIQWGSCAREDRFHKEHNHASTLQSLYQQCGALGNTHCYSKEFVKNDFSFKQAVYEHVNQVYTVAELFKAKKINKGRRPAPNSLIFSPMGIARSAGGRTGPSAGFNLQRTKM